MPAGRVPDMIPGVIRTSIVDHKDLQPITGVKR
jgi:hypothetical protein